MSRFSSSAASAALALLALATSCTFDEITVSRTTPTVVVHAILNPSSATQMLLLERTLTGTITLRDTVFDVNDPIVSGGGIPVNGATAEIIDSTGRSVRGVEDKHPTANRGTGVYRFAFGSTLRLGASYRLHVRTVEGEEVNATTRLPRPEVTSTGALSRTFNRDHDTAFVQWNRAPLARTYAVRIESPFGPFFLFTDSTRFRVTGELRNLFASDLQRVLVPGFRQDMLVAAVDSNFYDYYRTQNDPFTGSGIISRIEGGLGLFGSMVTMTSGTFTVVADQTEPVEGRFRLVTATTDVTAPVTLTLYIDARSPRADIPDALSGRYTTGGTSPRSDGILGEHIGERVRLVMLANQLSGDTVDVFTAEQSGNTLTGTFRRRSGTFVYSK